MRTGCPPDFDFVWRICYSQIYLREKRNPYIKTYDYLKRKTPKFPMEIYNKITGRDIYNLKYILRNI